MGESKVPPASQKTPLGKMLVDAGALTQDKLDQALSEHERTGRRLGEVLVSTGLISEPVLAQTLSNQLSIPWVSLPHVEFSRELLNLVKPEMAKAYGLIPVYLRKSRGSLRGGGAEHVLYVAMDDPTHVGVLDELSQTLGMPIRPMVAVPSDVRSAIRVYYFGGHDSSRPAGSGSTVPPELRGSQAPAQRVSEPLPPPPPIPKARQAQFAERSQPSADPTVQANISDDRPRTPKKSDGKMLTLTLLDGPRVSLPVPGAPGAADADERGEAVNDLTANDMVKALLAKTQGHDVSEVLGERLEWEPLFATLLTLLIKKGLIADWEFVELWKKHRPQA